MLLSINVPIAIGLAVTTVVAMVIKQGTDFLIDTAIVMYVGATNFPLIAIPLFILAGAIMNSSGISRRLIAFASALVGFIRGGLSMITFAASMFFAEISGSAVADVAALGSILIPAMKKKGYPAAFAAAVYFFVCLFGSYYSTINSNDFICGDGTNFCCSIICCWYYSWNYWWIWIDACFLYICKKKKSSNRRKI